jgi:hypothetical protein
MLESHLMAQVAACRAGVGAARWPCPRLLELRGAPMHLARRMPGGWWQPQSAHRALFLADRRSVAPIAFGPDVAVIDVSAAHAALILAGPLAARLAARLADPVMVAADGDHHRVLVVPASRAPGAWQALLDAGRRYGAVAVDVRATDLHRAAQPSFDPTTTGASTV